MTREEMIAYFARRQESWRRRDAAALAADHADNTVVESPIGGTLTGRAAVENIYKSLFLAFPDIEFQMDELVIDGNHVVLVWTSYGTHVGDFLGLSHSGKRFKTSGVFIYRLEAGKIAHERRIYDFSGLLIQLGILKAKPF